MIGKLTGRLDAVNENQALIDVNGVGYVALCSAQTLRRIGGIGSNVSLLIETQVREDAITLIGFADAEEKSAFKVLTTVQGVGTKVALSILSTLSGEQLSSAIINGDKALLSSADGVGPKLAARLMTELKDKVAQIGVSNVAAFHAATKSPIAVPNLAGDAVSTLTNLGFRRDEAFAAVMAVIGDDKDIGFDALVKKSLQELSPKQMGQKQMSKL